MKILVFSEYFPESPGKKVTGGVEARTYNISKWLAKDNDVTIITSWREGSKRNDKYDNIRIIRVGSNHMYSNKAGFFSRIAFSNAATKEGIRHAESEIVIGENFTTYFPAFYVANKLDRPCVITYHETWINEWVKNKGIITGVPYEIYERLLLKLNYSRIIAVSDFTRENLLENNIEPRKINVIHNGINPEDFSFECKKEKTHTICFIGRLVKTKKADILIKAIALIKKKIPVIKCKIIGQGDESNKLVALSNELGLKDNVEFLGFVKDTQSVRKILKSSTVFCLPSVAEGFGIVVIEAMASKTPYVCSDIPVLKEITEDGKGGFLFRENDAADLASKMIELLENRELYSAKEKEGMSLCQKYIWKDLTKDVENLYKQAINDYRFKNKR